MFSKTLFVIVSTIFSMAIVGHSFSFSLPFALDTKDFSWNDCGGSIVQFKKIDVSPKPIVLSETAEVFLTAEADIKDDVPNDAYLSLVVNRTLHIGGQNIILTLPCIDDIGSCTFNVCHLFSSWYNDIVCPFFKKQGRTCSCPIKKGSFQSENEKVNVPFEKLKGAIAKVAEGEYKIQFLIKDHTNTTNLACLDIGARLVVPKH